MGLCKLLSIVYDLNNMNATICSSSLRRDLKLRASVKSYFLKEAEYFKELRRGEAVCIIFLIMLTKYNKL